MSKNIRIFSDVIQMHNGGFSVPCEISFMDKKGEQKVAAYVPLHVERKTFDANIGKLFVDAEELAIKEAELRSELCDPVTGTFVGFTTHTAEQTEIAGCVGCEEGEGVEPCAVCVGTEAGVVKEDSPSSPTHGNPSPPASSDATQP
jgi:hypothetical protein